MEGGDPLSLQTGRGFTGADGGGQSRENLISQRFPLVVFFLGQREDARIGPVYLCVAVLCANLRTVGALVCFYCTPLEGLKFFLI